MLSLNEIRPGDLMAFLGKILINYFILLLLNYQSKLISRSSNDTEKFSKFIIDDW